MEYFILILLILPFILTLVGLLLLPYQLDNEKQKTFSQSFFFKNRYLMENYFKALSLKYSIVSYEIKEFNNGSIYLNITTK